MLSESVYLSAQLSEQLFVAGASVGSVVGATVSAGASVGSAVGATVSTGVSVGSAVGAGLAVA